MHQAVVCIAPTVTDAENLVGSLKTSGFTSDDISLMMPDSYGAQELAYERHTKSPEGLSVGFILGAILGGIAGYMASRGMFGTNNLEQVIAAGSLMATLAGIGVFGMVGALLGSLFGLTIPEYEARKFERRTRFGNTLMAVHTESESEARVVEKLFKDGGAVDIQRTTEETIKRPKEMQSIIEREKKNAA